MVPKHDEQVKQTVTKIVEMLNETAPDVSLQQVVVVLNAYVGSVLYATALAESASKRTAGFQLGAWVTDINVSTRAMLLHLIEDRGSIRGSGHNG